MGLFRSLFVLTLVAFAAVHAADIQDGKEPRDAEVIIVNIVDIVEIIRAHINEGIEKADPLIQQLLGLLTTDLAGGLGEIIDELRSIVASLDGRLARLGVLILGSLEQLNAQAQDCIDLVKPTIEDAAHGFETDFANEVNTILADNKEQLDALGEAITALQNQVDDTIVKAIADSTACLAPGASDGKECLDGVSEKFLQDVDAILGQLKALTTDNSELIGNILTLGVQKLGEILQVAIPSLKEDLIPFGECVAAKSVY